MGFSEKKKLLQKNSLPCLWILSSLLIFHPMTRRVACLKYIWDSPNSTFMLTSVNITSSASVTSEDDHQVLSSSDRPSSCSHCPCWQTTSPPVLLHYLFTQAALAYGWTRGLKRFIRTYFCSFCDLPMEYFGVSEAWLTLRFKHSNST